MGIRSSSLWSALLLLVVIASTASGQVSERRVRETIERAGTRFGSALAGGSPLVGPANTTGGLLHLEASAFVNATSLDVDDPRRSNGSLDFAFGTAGIGVAIRLLKGWQLGPTVGGFGSLDVIARVGVVSDPDDFDDLSGLKTLGVRVGVVRDGPAVPALSVTMSRTWLDDLSFGANDPDDVRFTGDVSVLSVRADVSKRLLVVTPYIGVGIDRSEVDATYTIPGGVSTGGTTIRGSIEARETSSRAYVGAAFGFLFASVAVEVGTADGGAFGSLAARFGI